MKKNLKNDLKKRSMYLRFELKRKVLKSLIRDETLKYSLRCLAFNELSILNRRYGKSKIHNFCLESKRSRGVFRIFRLSKHSIKREGNLGNLSGLRKRN